MSRAPQVAALQERVRAAQMRKLRELRQAIAQQDGGECAAGEAGPDEAAVEERDLPEVAVEPAPVGEVAGLEDHSLAAPAAQLGALEATVLQAGRLERHPGKLLSGELEPGQLDVVVLVAGRQSGGAERGEIRGQRRHVRKRLPAAGRFAPLT
jgi:hypothetical protein